VSPDFLNGESRFADLAQWGKKYCQKFRAGFVITHAAGQL
jgi:hypothetical protein